LLRSVLLINVCLYCCCFTGGSRLKTIATATVVRQERCCDDVMGIHELVHKAQSNRTTRRSSSRHLPHLLNNDFCSGMISRLNANESNQSPIQSINQSKDTQSCIKINIRVLGRPKTAKIVPTES
jgi:hypothetical protein